MPYKNVQCRCITCHKHTSNKDSPCTSCGERTWKKKGSKDIHVVRVEDNRQITIVVSFAINGSSLPLQIICIKSTTRCLLQNGLGKVSCSFDTFY